MKIKLKYLINKIKKNLICLKVLKKRFSNRKKKVNYYLDEFHNPFLNRLKYSKYQLSDNFYYTEKYYKNPLQKLNSQGKKICSFEINSNSFSKFISELFIAIYPEWEVVNSNESNFKWYSKRSSIDYNCLSNYSIQLVNRFEFSEELTSFKNLFFNLNNYCESNKLNLFDLIPFSFIFEIYSKDCYEKIELFKKFFKIISKGISFITKKSMITKFLQSLFQVNNYNNKTISSKNNISELNIWIFKPISKEKNDFDCEIFDNIEKFINLNSSFEQFDRKESISKSQRAKSFALQKYIENQFLYYGKLYQFKIFVLYNYNSYIYLYKHGYLKISRNFKSNLGREFSIFDPLKQKLENYEFIKISKPEYIACEDFIEFCRISQNNYWNTLIPQVKNLVEISLKSIKYKINKNERKYCFEIFEYSFLIDSDFRVWLEKINPLKAPDLSSNMLRKFYTNMLKQALSIVIDNLFSENQSLNIKNLNSDNENEAPNKLWEFLFDNSVKWKRQIKL